MAQDNDEQDFIEIFNSIKAAHEVLKRRQTGMRMSKSPEEYGLRLNTAWDYTSKRAKQCGDETNHVVRYRANEILRMLQNDAHIGQVFSQLHNLNNLKRARWKNKEDIENLNQLVSSLWQRAKEQAQQQTAKAQETALQLVDESMILADFSFDWKFINEQLRETENLLHYLPLPPSQKRPYQDLISQQFDLVREREQKDNDKFFDYDEWLFRIRWHCIQSGMVDIKNQRWPQDEMKGQLSVHNLFVLTHIYDIVLSYSKDSEGNPFAGIEYDETTLDYVIIRKFRLPSIWHQPYTKIRIDFPKSYPETPPIGWYMENDLKIKGWENAYHYFPNKAFHGAQVHQGWAWYCCIDEVFIKSPVPPTLLEALDTGTGRVVVASSLEDEKSYYNGQYSYFTECLLEGLQGKASVKKDGYARILDILIYLFDQVPVRSPGEQHPFVKKMLDLGENFPLCYYAGGSKFLPGELSSSEQNISLTVLTTGQRQRLQQKLDIVQRDWDLQSKKVQLLRKAKVRTPQDTMALVFFQLEQELIEEEATLAQLQSELEEIEQVLK
jgi:hypothetical protein